MEDAAETEACPQCESTYTERVLIEGEPWWRCKHQGCAGRVSGAAYYWRDQASEAR